MRASAIRSLRSSVIVEQEKEIAITKIKKYGEKLRTNKSVTHLSDPNTTIQTPIIVKKTIITSSLTKSPFIINPFDEGINEVEDYFYYYVQKLK